MPDQRDNIGGSCTNQLVTQRSVNLSTRTLGRTLWRVERIPDPLPCIIQIAAGAFGWTFLMAGR